MKDSRVGARWAAAMLCLAIGCGDDATMGTSGGATRGTSTTGGDPTSSSEDTTGSTSSADTTDATEEGTRGSSTTRDESTTTEASSSSSGSGSEESSSSSGEPESVCGNGVVEGLEACDDGNEYDHDGCSPDCTDPCAGSPATTIYVDRDAPSGGDGTSWGSAYNHVYDAISTAPPNTEIWIAEGAYFPLQENLPIVVLRECVDLYGGFQGTETSVDERPANGKHRTVLDGDIEGDDYEFFWGENAHHIFVAIDVSNVIIDRITATRGRAIATLERGGAIHLDNSNVVVRDGALEDSFGDEGGGAYVGNGSTLWTYGVDFQYNTSPFGGALAVDDSSVAIVGEGTHFFRNNAGERGGAIYVDDGTLEMSGATVERNRGGALGPPLADGQGGGVFVNGSASSATITDTVFVDNDADEGGAIYSNGSEDAVSISECTFTSNVAFAGGALRLRGGSVNQSTFTQNVGVDSGGAIYNVAGAAARVADSTFIENSANSGGGAIDTLAPVQIERCTFENNETTNFGGGAIRAALGVTSSGSTYTANRAEFGGAIWIGPNAEPSALSHDHFEDNVADTTGGALATEGTLDPSMVTIDASMFAMNSAGTRGGAAALFVPYRVYDCAFIGNAADEGGALYTASIGSASVVHASFSNNDASDPESAGGMHLRSLSGEPQATVRNVTMWGNGDDLVGEAFADVEFTCTQEALGGANNIVADGDPFVVGAAGELYLDQSSNCIDQGDDAFADLVYDAIYDQGDGYWMSLSTAADGTLDSVNADPAHHSLP